MKLRLTWAPLVLIFLLAACGQKENPETDNLTGVQFSIPDKMEINYGAPTLSFRVQFSKAPASGDLLVLGSLPACPIINISSTSFDVSIASLWDQGFGNGQYEIVLRRGSVSRKMGQMQVVIKADDELKPASGATVYGKVLCEGQGIPNAVVSDGFNAVKTDKDGVYQLPSKKEHGYVFVSVPSGYEPARSGILPVIHQQLSASPSVAERVDFTLLKADGQENHTMLMLGDLHLANRTDDRKQFKDLVADINSYTASATGKVYAMTLGDMTWDLYWEVNNYGYKEYLEDAKAITGLTIYQTIGNHDHSMYEVGDFNTVKEYKEVIGPTYYSFNIGGVHYIVLDDVECTNATPTTDNNGKTCYVRDYNASLVQDQLDWLEKDLSFVPKTTPLVVTMHIPLYKPSGSYRFDSNGAKFEYILRPYSQVQLFTAHTHTVYNVDKSESNHIFEHNAGAICGTWWWSAKETPGVHIGQDGSPGGYTIVKVNGTNFSWQFKPTGGNVSEQFRAYDRNEIHITGEKYVPDGTKTFQENGKTITYQASFDPGVWETASSANEVYVNVWNWDPSWSVEVSENGTPLTVTHETQMDPLHLIAYTAKRLNKNSKATFPTYENTHMFKVQASSATSTLDIKVTDRFGNVYSESMTRPRSFSTDTYKH